MVRVEWVGRRHAAGLFERSGDGNGVTLLAENSGQTIGRILVVLNEKNAHRDHRPSLAFEQNCAQSPITTEALYPKSQKKLLKIGIVYRYGDKGLVR